MKRFAELTVMIQEATTTWLLECRNMTPVFGVIMCDALEAQVGLALKSLATD